MKKPVLQFFLTGLMIFLICGNAFSANELFRSVASGNWNANSTWEMSTNGGGSWFAATSTPSDTSGGITIQSPNIVTVTVNVSVDQLSVNGGTISINSGIFLDILDGSGTDLVLNGGGTISGSGFLRTMGNVTMILRNSSNMSSKVRFTAGTITSYNDQSPNIANYFGTVTLNTGAIITTLGGGYFNRAYANVTNNGTIAGNSFIMRGSSFVNNGTVSAGNLSFDSVTSLSGNRVLMFPGTIFINSTGNISLSNNVTFTPSDFTINGGGVLNPNNKTFTQNSGVFHLNGGGTVFNSGIFQTQGTVSMVIRNGSNFNGAFKINSGTTTSYNDQSPNISEYFGSMTLDPRHRSYHSWRRLHEQSIWECYQ